MLPCPEGLVIETKYEHLNDFRKLTKPHDQAPRVTESTHSLRKPLESSSDGSEADVKHYLGWMGPNLSEPHWE